MVSRRSCRRFRCKLNEMDGRLAETVAENTLLKDEISQIRKMGGISESTVLFLIGEISRIDNNIYHMQDVPGRKQISKAVERMKTALQTEDYLIVPLLGTEYREGMQVTAAFINDEGLPSGSSVITSVQKPQVDRGGRMIQAATVTVAQNE